MLHLERHGAPFFPFCNYLFKRICLWTMFHGRNHGLIFSSSSSSFSLDLALVPNNYHFYEISVILLLSYKNCYCFEIDIKHTTK